MGFFEQNLLGLDPNSIKLLSVRIVTNEEHRYFISFSKHHPQLQTSEFVRLVLHYYAKVLFNFDQSDPEMAQSALILRGMMQSLLDQGFWKDSSILQDAQIDDVAKIVSSPPTNKPREIVATLFFVNVMQRHITTEIPKNVSVQHVVFSVPVLVQAILTELDERGVEVLYHSLFNMNEAYESGQSYSDLQNLSAIPTVAYVSATTGE